MHSREKSSAPCPLEDDPLVRSIGLDTYSWWMPLVFLASAAGLHLVVGAGIGVVAEAFATSHVPTEEKIIVDIREITVPEPPPVEPKPPLAETEPEPQLKPEPKPKPKPKPKPEPEPESEPELEPKLEPPKPAPRRVIGLDLGSTVKGAGPTFAGGNAQDGSTSRVAIDPTKVKADPGESVKPVQGAAGPNRRASIVPQSGVEFVKPKRKNRVKPDYPPTPKAQGIEANVVVEVEIAANGQVTSVEVIAPAKEESFNSAARAAAMRETFSPARKNGKAIAFRLTFTYRFRISD